MKQDARSASRKAAATRVCPDDRRLRWGVAAAAALLGIGTYLVSLALAARLEGGIYRAWFGPQVSRWLSLQTGRVPFSVADLLIAAYVFWLLTVAARTLTSLARRRRRWRNALAGGLRRTVRDAGLLTGCFYILWGWNYARPGFAADAGWTEWTPPGTPELIALTEAATAEANRAYLDLHGAADAGRPTRFADDTLAAGAALDEGWVRATEHLGLAPAFASRYGRVKRPLGSFVLQRLGILGIYFPFTAEANVVRGMPAVRAASAMGHEQAHQRGITSEAEAGFLGYVAAALAPGRIARYSAAAYAMTRLSSALAAADNEQRRRIAETRLPGVRRDLADLAAFLSRASLVGSRVQTAVNDRYLRANRVPGGRANYAMATRLLVMYARRHGGAVLPG